MKLIVDRVDLKSEFVFTNCSQIKFEHFKSDVQQAIESVGRALFEEFDKSSYNAIFSPRKN